MSRTLQEFWAEFAPWSNKVFGTPQHRGPIGPLKHLVKEATEAQVEPVDLEELADCMFLIVDATRRAGFTHDQLIAMLFFKLNKNKKRKWINTGNPNEPIEHDRARD